MSVMIENSDVVRAEQIFNNRNVLLLTYHERELNNNIIKKLHLGIKNVHILQPIYIPKWRCVIEIQENCNVDVIRRLLMKKPFGDGFVTADYVKTAQDTEKNIDPCTLYVRNMPKNSSARDVAILFPLCKQYQLIPSAADNTKTALLRFPTVKDAIAAYKSTNNITYQSHVLVIQFYRPNLAIHESFIDHEIIDCDDDHCSETNEDEVEHENLEDNVCLDNEIYYNEDNEDYDVRNEELEDSSVTAPMEDKHREHNEAEPSSSINTEESTKDKSKANSISGAGHSRQNQSEMNERQRLSDVEFVLKTLREEKVEGINFRNKNLDPYTVSVYNLPSVTTMDEILKLYPTCERYNLVTAAFGQTYAEVSFRNAKETLKAYKATNNLIYKKKALTVRFNCNHFVKNSKKRKISFDERDNVTNKGPSTSTVSGGDSDDDVIITGYSKNSDEEMKEDDVEFKSEDEVYVDDEEVVLEDEDEDDYPVEDDDLQSLELDESDTFLPNDEEN